MEIIKLYLNNNKELYKIFGINNGKLIESFIDKIKNTLEESVGNIINVNNYNELKDKLYIIVEDFIMDTDIKCFISYDIKYDHIEININLLQPFSLSYTQVTFSI